MYMCVYICVCICVHIFMWIYIYRCIEICKCIDMKMFLNLYIRKGTTRTIPEPFLASQLSFDKGVTNIWNNSIGARRKWWLVFGLYWDGTQEKENEARAIIQVLSPYVLVYFLNGIMLWVSMRYRMEKKKWTQRQLLLLNLNKQPDFSTPVLQP